MEYTTQLVALMKGYINGDTPVMEDGRRLLLQVGKEIDRRQVEGQRSDYLTTLYNDVLWLLCKTDK